MAPRLVSFSIDRANQGMDLIHIRVKFERQARPIEILQSLALL